MHRSSNTRTSSILVAVALLPACTPGDAQREPLALRQTEWSSADAELAAVALGEATTCITTTSGHATCWGRGDDGRLGQGRTLAGAEADPIALEPLALGGPAIMVVTNGAQSFALLDDGTVRAFGLNPAHELGLDHPEAVGDDELPGEVAAVPLAGPAQQVAAGQGFACALLDDGRVQCWGRGDEGQLGRGVLAGSQPPGDVILGGPAVELAVGAAHACARLSAGNVRCWGLPHDGRLGHGSGSAAGSLPALAGDVPLGGVATQLVAGGAHSCAVLDTGALRCWGDGSWGQLGHGHAEAIGDDEVPAEVGDVPLSGAVVEVAAGLRHTCARLDTGALHCWGSNADGQLGRPSSPSIAWAEAGAVALGGAEIEAIVAGALAEHTCAVLDGHLRCWGRNDYGQVGLGFASPSDPVEGPPGDLPDVIIVDDPDA